MSKASDFNRRKGAYNKGFKDGQAAATPAVPSVAVKGLDWSGFKGVKINEQWTPDDQELIYTALGVYDGDGDMDDDAREQIIERLLAAWQRSTLTAQVQDVVCETCKDTGKEARHQICRDCDGHNCDDGCAYPEPASKPALSVAEPEIVETPPDLHLKMARTQALDDAAKLASGMMLDLGHTYAYRHLPLAIRDLVDKPSGTASFFQDVVNLVIAAREFWDINNDLTDESRALDKALEAFAETAPYENQPDDVAAEDQEASE